MGPVRTLALLAVGAVTAVAFHLAPHDLTREQVWLVVSVIACLTATIGALRNTPSDRLVAVGMPAMLCSLALLSALTGAGLAANIAALVLNAVLLRRTWRYLRPGTDGRGGVEPVIVTGSVTALLLLGADLADPGNALRALIFAVLLGMVAGTALRRGVLIAPIVIVVAAVLSWTMGLAVELHHPSAVTLREVFVAIAWLWLGCAPLHPEFADQCGPPELRQHRRALLRLLLLVLLLVVVIATLALAPAGAVATAGRLGVAALVTGTIVWRVGGLLRHGDRELAAVRRQSLTDPLTGLANRAGLVEALGRAERQGRSSAVLMVDVDGFRMLNDGLGFAAGDTLLVRVADRLRAAVGDRGTAARLTGDEFAVLLTDVRCEDGCHSFAQSLQAAIAAPATAHGATDVPLRASVGIAPPGARGAEECLRNAQVALTHAKASGRGRIETYDEAMADHAHDRAMLVADLHGAVGRGELHLAYQPILDVDAHRMVAVEALLRWDHPTRGPVAPDRFVALAESAGLILPIGRWVIDEALRVAAELRRAGHRDIVMHVNLSPVQLRDDAGLIGHLQAALAAHAVEPRALLLEITEGVLVDGDVALRALARIRDLGVRLGLDDFGTGYASINYLDRLALDVVKLDKVFTARIGRGDLVGAGILRFLDGLAPRIIAEGVESADELPALRQLGCDMVQGYAFARPLSGHGLHLYAGGAGAGVQERRAVDVGATPARARGRPPGAPSAGSPSPERQPVPVRATTGGPV